MVDVTEGEEEKPKKKSGLVMTIVAVAVLTLIGAGGGWVVGGMLSKEIEPPKPEAKAAADVSAENAAAKPERKEGEGLPHIATEENGVVQLEPITTNLAFPTERWVRLEVALLFKDKPDVKLAEAIHEDIAMYMRTVTLQQIEGPRGFQYLKDDLEERADILSEGKVDKILFRTFVVQ